MTSYTSVFDQVQLSNGNSVNEIVSASTTLDAFTDQQLVTGASITTIAAEAIENNETLNDIIQDDIQKVWKDISITTILPNLMFPYVNTPTGYCQIYGVKDDTTYSSNSQVFTSSGAVDITSFNILYESVSVSSVKSNTIIDSVAGMFETFTEEDQMYTVSYSCTSASGTYSGSGYVLRDSSTTITMIGAIPDSTSITNESRTKLDMNIDSNTTENVIGGLYGKCTLTVSEDTTMSNLYIMPVVSTYKMELSNVQSLIPEYVQASVVTESTITESTITDILLVLTPPDDSSIYLTYTPITGNMTIPASSTISFIYPSTILMSKMELTTK